MELKTVASELTILDVEPVIRAQMPQIGIEGQTEVEEMHDIYTRGVETPSINMFLTNGLIKLKAA